MKLSDIIPPPPLTTTTLAANLSSSEPLVISFIPAPPAMLLYHLFASG